MHGHLARADPEGAHPDDRILRIGIHVRVRGQIQLEAVGAHLPGDGPGAGAGQLRVVEPAQHRVARLIGAVAVVQPGDVSALFIQCQNGVGGRLADLGHEGGELLGVLDIAAVDAQRPHGIR